jgi:hypothetical protein
MIFWETVMFSGTVLKNLQEYLSSVYKAPVRVLSTEEIGKKNPDELKSFGYGKPYKITYEVNQEVISAVLETMSANSFGHDHFSDRAQILLWSHSVYSKLPKHVRSIDAGAFTKDQRMISAGEAEEFFLLAEFVEGQEYASDLYRIFSGREASPLDLERATALANYLAEIHRTTLHSPHLYRRKIRDLLGHGECIMGLIDNYPAEDPVATPARLQKIETECLRWRWIIKGRPERLCQVHGDFHPWNILFRNGVDFTVLDRSRGEWGEPADDVSSMLINYIFMALQKEGLLTGEFEKLCNLFWEKYFQETKDLNMVKVIQPFLAWRGLVLGNPVWYPNLSVQTREKIFNLIENVLASETFDLQKVNQYIE